MNRFGTAIVVVLVASGCGGADTSPAVPASRELIVPQGDAQIVAPPQEAIEAGNTLDAERADFQDLQLVEPSNEQKKQALLEQRRQLDRQVWGSEVLAQQYEQTFVKIWDDLLAQNDRADSGDKYGILRGIEFDRFRIGSAGPSEELEFGIHQTALNTDASWLEKQVTDALLGQYAEQGYRVVQTEFHHSRFSPDVGDGAKSSISAVFYVEKRVPQARYMLRGTFEVRWHPLTDQTPQPRLKDIDATDFVVLSRVGKLPYEEILTVDHTVPDKRAGVQPLLVRDLNNDGLSEIVLAGANEVLWNEGQAQFATKRLCPSPLPIYETGLLADTTGDGHLDLIVPGHRGDLLLYKGDGRGRFADEPIGKARGGGPLRQPQVITVGDIDLDGDLDLWVAQYRISYLGGQMPTPLLRCQRRISSLSVS